MTLLPIYLAAMLVPGAAVCRILGLGRVRLFLSIALSLGVMVVCLLAARMLQLGTTGLGVLLLAACVVLVIAAYVRPGPASTAPPENPWPGVVVFSLTLSLIALYLAWAGPYLEIPADGWYHIGEINDRIDELIDDDIGSFNSMGEAVGADARYWYTIVAYLVHLSGKSFEAAVEQLALANSLLFSAAVYSFALFLFGAVISSPLRRHAVAALSVFFFFTQFGIGVFSYLRYYTFAPAFLNYVVYLAAISCLLSLLGRERLEGRLFATFAFLGVLSAMLHVQEAMFVLVMTVAIVAIAYIGEFGMGEGRTPDTIPASGTRRDGRRKALAFAFWIMVAGYFALHVVAYESFDRHDPLAHGRLQDIGNYLPFLRRLYILNPTYQFYQVVTVWGVLVYVLFMLNWRRFMSPPYLAAGMLVPFVTVFNPLFTDFFLRISNPGVLWRICFVLPLPFLGAYFFVRGVERIRNAPGMAARVRTALVPALLLLLLLPIETRYFVASHSKLHMLAPVAAGNDHRNWQDLFEFLGGMETSGVITDSVTGYAINGMTRHFYRGWKFTGTYAPKVNLDSYDDEKFRAQDGWKKLIRDRDFDPKRPWLVIINQRNGTASKIGRLGRHWPEAVMAVSRYYSPAFIEYVRGSGGMFRKIWENQGIEVYEVIPT